MSSSWSPTSATVWRPPRPLPVSAPSTCPTGGTCELTSDATGITLSAEAATEDDLARIQDVVARHLLRFTDIPTLTEDWAPVG